MRKSMLKQHCHVLLNQPFQQCFLFLCSPGNSLRKCIAHCYHVTSVTFSLEWSSTFSSLIYLTVLKTTGLLLWKTFSIWVSSIFPHDRSQFLHSWQCHHVFSLPHILKHLLLQGSLLDYSGRWYLESKIWEFIIVIATRVLLLLGPLNEQSWKIYMYACIHPYTHLHTCLHIYIYIYISITISLPICVWIWF